MNALVNNVFEQHVIKIMIYNCMDAKYVDKWVKCRKVVKM